MLASTNAVRRPLEEDNEEQDEELFPLDTKRHKPSTIFDTLSLPLNQPLTNSYTYFSNHQPIKTTQYVLGVDEAGRGPVLGPMVYATCFCTTEYYSTLSSLGFADSKQLTEEQRDKLFEILQNAKHTRDSGWSIRAISPRDISSCMLRRSKYNLNSLAHDATIQLIRDALDKGISLSHVYIDTVGPPATYEKKLREIFPNVEITVAKKADSLYPIVSAASICAKVIRDKHLSGWIFSENNLESKISRVYGSGYPGDPNTIKWLKNNLDMVFGYPGIIRFSWSTCQKILQEQAISVQWPDDEDAPNNNKLVSAYFSQKNVSNGPVNLDINRPRSRFFGRRRPIDLAVTL